MVDPTPPLPVIRVERRTEIDDLRDEVRRLREIFEPLVAACEADFCSDATEKDEMRCDDDDSVAAGMDEGRIVDSAVTFGMIRRARAALTPRNQND